MDLVPKKIKYKIKKQLNEDFCECYVDNKLSIHFGEGKTRSILFASKRKPKNVCQLNIRYNYIDIKQHLQFACLGWVLDKAMLSEPMELMFINKINGKSKFPYRKHRYLTEEIHRILCNALI